MKNYLLILTAIFGMMLSSCSKSLDIEEHPMNNASIDDSLVTRATDNRRCQANHFDDQLNQGGYSGIGTSSRQSVKQWCTVFRGFNKSTYYFDNHKLYFTGSKISVTNADNVTYELHVREGLSGLRVECELRVENSIEYAYANVIITD